MSKFCKSCGAKVTDEKPKCSQCGNELNEGAKFCPICGTPTGGQSAQSAQSAQPSPPPVYTQPQSPSEQPQSRGKLGAGGIIVGALVAVVLIGGGYALYRHFQNNEYNPAFEILTKREAANGEQSKKNSEQGEKETVARTGRVDSVSKQLEDLARESMNNTDDKNETPDNSDKKEDTEGKKQDNNDKIETTDYDRPENIEDFDWLNDVMEGDYDFPEDTEFLESPADISGRWKVIQKYFDDYGLLDEYDFRDMPATAVELLNIDIAEKGGDNAEFVFDWYKILYAGDPQFTDESDMDKISFVIDLSDEEPSDENEVGTLMIYGFWNSDDKQYGMGMLALPDDTYSIIGFMRP